MNDFKKEHQLRFALVGCGHISARHAQHISAVAELAAVCDTDLLKAQRLAEKYSCRAYSSIEELLQSETDVDVVSICTPNALHAEHSIAALRASKHVVCEKPMAINVADCEHMIMESTRTNKRLFIIKQNRFNPPVVALKQAIDENRLGKILNVQLNCFWNRNDDYYLNSDWKGKKALDGGILFTQFSHFIDLVYWLAGDIEHVYAMQKNFIHKETVEFEDTVVIAMQFKSGALGTMNCTINSYGKNMEGSITVFGEKGTVKVGGQYLNVLEYQNIDNYEITHSDESRPANDYGFYQGSMSNHDKVYENVVDVLKNEGVIATNGIEGLKIVQIIEKIYSAVDAK
jgi:predicted dehydrogenase